MNNRYFILPYPNVHSAVWDIVVESPATLRTNNIGNFCVVKLYVGDQTDHPILNGFPEYDHAGILVEMAKPEWTEEI